MKRAVLYLRISTIEQAANQERVLCEVGERAGWQITKIYIDYGIRGPKAGRCALPSKRSAAMLPGGNLMW
jgi:DNA invertase Pin-like site-specific DNA recombinase